MSLSTDKKGAVVVEEENATPLSRVATDRLDGAGKFLEMHRDLDVSHIDVTKLRHKVDWRVSRASTKSYRKPAMLILLLDCPFDVRMLHNAIFGQSHLQCKIIMFSGVLN
jgi:hypothetical protein